MTILSMPHSVIPSDPESRKRIYVAMKEMSDSFTREQAEKDLRKEIAERILEEEGVPKASFNAFSKTLYNGKSKYEEKVAKEDQKQCDFENLLPNGEDTIF